ncbi:MAG: hypothetical protein IPN62_16720 [Flavobacteriales bacterium]|nr:hypothetical protein [Flavobacteriales bacterium]
MARSTMHTAIRPYRRSEVMALVGADSLRPTAAWNALDRWAGAGNGRRFRFGPLLEATGGFDASAQNTFLVRSGGSVWLGKPISVPSSMFTSMAWAGRSACRATGLPRWCHTSDTGEGYAETSGDSGSHYDLKGT